MLLFRKYGHWLWRRLWQCTWQTVGWSISFPKGNDGGCLCSERPHCAPIRAESWVVCPSTADLGLGLRKAAHPYRFQRVKPRAPAALCPLQPYMHKDTCCSALLQRLNQFRCLQPNKHKCHLPFSLLSFTWLKKCTCLFCFWPLAVIRCQSADYSAVFNVGSHNTAKPFEPDMIFHPLRIKQQCSAEL